MNTKNSNQTQTMNTKNSNQTQTMNTKNSNQTQIQTAFFLPSTKSSQKTIVLFSETQPVVELSGLFVLNDKLQLLLYIISTRFGFKTQLRSKYHNLAKLTKLKLVLWDKSGYVLTDLGKNVSEYLNLPEKFKDQDIEKVRNKFFSLENVNPEIIERSIQFMELTKQGFSCREISRSFDISGARVNQILHLHPEYHKFLKEKRLARREALGGKNLKTSNKRKIILNVDKLEDYWDWDKNKTGPAEAIKGKVEDVFLNCPKCSFTWYQPAQPDLKDEENFVTTDTCPSCAFKPRKKYEKQKTLMEVYPDLVSKYWDTEKNSAMGADPAQLTIHSSLFAFFKCSKHGAEWEKRVDLMNFHWAKGKYGCRECVSEKIKEKIRLFKYELAEKSAAQLP